MPDNIEKIKCPACGKEMEEIYIPNADFGIDICIHGCGGIYFDKREFKYFDEPSENIEEINNALENKTFIKVDENLTRVCPICGTNMVKNYASIKKEVQIDECYNCGGKFLDYGELEKIRAQYETEEERTADVMNYLYSSVGIQLNERKNKTDSIQFKHSLFKKFFDKLIIG